VTTFAEFATGTAIGLSDGCELLRMVGNGDPHLIAEL
jgi:hypothetical protein